MGDLGQYEPAEQECMGGESGACAGEEMVEVVLG
jgi:hypothetical protein